MLSQVHLTNFTIIDQLDLSFHPGMTVITGETGAGKSIIIDAIELALGNRLDTNVVGLGKERCNINLLLDISENKNAQIWLQEKELLNDEHDCVIRRTITQDGRSKCYINNQPTTLQSLAEFGSLLINIHGQHQHQALLKREQQRILLDEYAGNHTLALQVKSLFQQWVHTTEQIKNLSTVNLEKSNRREFLQYQLQEFNKLALQENEIQDLNNEHKQLTNADSLISHCSLALNYISEREESSVLHLLQIAIKELQANKISQTKLDDSLKLLDDSLVLITEAGNQLKNFLGNIEDNPEKLQQVEQRLAEIHHISRKYRIQGDQILTFTAQLQSELDKIENYEEELLTLQKQLVEIENDYYLAANKLTKSREKASAELSRLISKNMHELGMSGGKFAIEFNYEEFKKPLIHGLEKFEFLVSANAGQPLQPLNKVASGGELSRISLAIQVIMAKKVAIPTLIFDEVDVGIGGKTAEIVGRLLRDLGKSAQVICITHHAQVASLSQQHFRVVKTEINGATQTAIEELDHPNKIEEIARMLGGINITQQTRAVAAEMVNNV